MSGAWKQNIPVVLVTVTCIAGIGGLQSGVHKLFHSDRPRWILRDQFDRCMDKRDDKLDALAQQRVFAAKQQAEAAREAAAQAAVQ